MDMKLVDETLGRVLRDLEEVRDELTSEEIADLQRIYLKLTRVSKARYRIVQQGRLSAAESKLRGVDATYDGKIIIEYNTNNKPVRAVPMTTQAVVTALNQYAEKADLFDRMRESTDAIRTLMYGKSLGSGQWDKLNKLLTDIEAL